MLFLYCSAIIEHTNRVLYMEDNDVAAVTADGGIVIKVNIWAFCVRID